MGSMKDIAGMLPGMKNMPSTAGLDDEFKITEVLIGSMTPLERQQPSLINVSRRKRIAMGSGKSIDAVNKLLKQYNDMNKMMRLVQKKGMKNIINQMGGMFK